MVRVYTYISYCGCDFVGSALPFFGLNFALVGSWPLAFLDN